MRGWTKLNLQQVKVPNQYILFTMKSLSIAILKFKFMCHVVVVSLASVLCEQDHKQHFHRSQYLQVPSSQLLALHNNIPTSAGVSLNSMSSAQEVAVF